MKGKIHYIYKKKFSKIWGYKRLESSNTIENEYPRETYIKHYNKLYELLEENI